jgi:hypothetical protein
MPLPLLFPTLLHMRVLFILLVILVLVLMLPPPPPPHGSTLHVVPTFQSSLMFSMVTSELRAPLVVVTSSPVQISKAAHTLRGAGIGQPMHHLHDEVQYANDSLPPSRAGKSLRNEKVGLETSRPLSVGSSPSARNEKVGLETSRPLSVGSSPSACAQKNHNGSSVGQ